MKFSEDCILYELTIPTKEGKCMLQLCYIITDSKPFLRHNKQVNHWLKWDKFVVEGINHKNEDVPNPMMKNFTISTLKITSGKQSFTAGI